jgi:hypothetical protein
VPPHSGEAEGHVILCGANALASRMAEELTAFAAAVLDQKMLRVIAVGRHVLLLAEVSATEGALIGTQLAAVHRPGLLRVIAARGERRRRGLVAGS